MQPHEEACDPYSNLGWFTHVRGLQYLSGSTLEPFTRGGIFQDMVRTHSVATEIDFMAWFPTSLGRSLRTTLRFSSFCLCLLLYFCVANSQHYVFFICCFDAKSHCSVKQRPVMGDHSAGSPIEPHNSVVLNLPHHLQRTSALWEIHLAVPGVVACSGFSYRGGLAWSC